MTGPPPATAATRVAVRRALADLAPPARVLCAVSGGPDSLALLAAAVVERAGRCAAAVVDHGWTADSADRCAQVAATARGWGADPVAVLAAPTPRSEAAARDARYPALLGYATAIGAAAVLLGHTRDDQAETVLLGLARGSGARSAAGMAPRRGVLRRPLLDLPRAVTVQACAEAGVTPWRDAANDDPAFARSRLRTAALPTLRAALGEGVVAGLARSAQLLRDDADALDAWARAAAPAVHDPERPGELDVAEVLALPPAVRRRVLRDLTGARTAVQLAAVEGLVTSWRGQGAVALPGGRSVRRAGQRLLCTPAAAWPRAAHDDADVAADAIAADPAAADPAAADAVAADAVAADAADGAAAADAADGAAADGAADGPADGHAAGHPGAIPDRHPGAIPDTRRAPHPAAVCPVGSAAGSCAEPDSGATAGAAEGARAGAGSGAVRAGGTPVEAAADRAVPAGCPAAVPGPTAGPVAGRSHPDTAGPAAVSVSAPTAL